MKRQKDKMEKLEQVGNGFAYEHIANTETWLCVAHVKGSSGNLAKYILARLRKTSSEETLKQVENCPTFIGENAYERAMKYYYN